MDVVIQQLLLSTIAVSLLICTILLLKKVLTKHLSVKAHYRIWLFLFVPLLASVLPWKFFGLSEGLQSLQSLLTFSDKTMSHGEAISGATASQEADTEIMRDFSISVNNTTPAIVHDSLFAVWMIGMIVCLGFFFYSNYQISRLKKSAVTINNTRVNELLEECKQAVGIKRKIILKETGLITTPITFGVMQPYILVPTNMQEAFTIKEMKYVFLHELTHHRNKDMLVNYLMWILQIVYWFNPLVWYAQKRLRMDRELACDDSVLNLLDEAGYLEYGHTIIHFAGNKQGKSFELFASGIGGTKKQIKQRILHIASFSKESSLLKWKSKAVYLFLSVLVLCITPLTTVLATSNDVFHFNGKNTTYEDLSSYFEGYKGSFVLYDAASEQYQIYNQERSKKRVSPDSTYKIYSGLFALEANVISNLESEQKWNGQHNPYKEWDKDHNLSSAMRNSVNWYFQNLDKELGRQQLHAYFDKTNYGNKDISGDLENYWMESTLKISPIEQVQLLHGLSENKLGFKAENVQTIKDTLLLEDDHNSQLYGKTGTGTINEQDVNGWFVGFIEKGKHSYYFAVNIQNNGKEASGSEAMKIAKQILKDKKLY